MLAPFCLKPNLPLLSTMDRRRRGMALPVAGITMLLVLWMILRLTHMVPSMLRSDLLLRLPLVQRVSSSTSSSFPSQQKLNFYPTSWEETAGNATTRTNTSSKTEITFDELGIGTEREARGLCDRLLRQADTIPDNVNCECQVKILQRSIVLICDTNYCLDETIFPRLVSERCLKPTYQGRLRLPGRTLISTLCHDPITISYALTPLDESINVRLPQVCVRGKHDRTNWDRFTSCQVWVGADQCLCNLCKGGTQVSIDCRNARALGLLRAIAKVDCLPLDIFS